MHRDGAPAKPGGIGHDEHRAAHDQRREVSIGGHGDAKRGRTPGRDTGMDHHRHCLPGLPGWLLAWTRPT